MKTAIISSDSYEKHITGDGHPEQPKRVIAIKEKLKKRKDLIWEKPDKVPEEILSMTHSKDYIENLKNFIILGLGLDGFLILKEVVRPLTR